MASTLTRTRSAAIPHWLTTIIDGIDADDRDDARPVRSEWLPDHSNEIHQVTFSDGRVLVVKRGWQPWSASYFETSAAAARLIASRSDVVVPRPIPIHASVLDAAGGTPVQAYWRLPLPTLADLWPSLSTDRRREALRGVGRLLRRVHAIEAPGYGPLGGEYAPDLEAELNRDLLGRLVPAVYTHWPEGLRSLESLIERIPSVARPRAGRQPAVIHHDLHLGNILCRAIGGRVAVVGLLDLDEAAGGAPESDLAVFQVLHGPIFERRIDAGLLREVEAGYGTVPDPLATEFFRCAHLVNQGFSSALLGHTDHAAAVAAELRRRMSAFARPRASIGRTTAYRDER